MNEMTDLNNSLLELWEATPSEHLNGLMPLLLNDVEKESIIFIGLSPSFSEKGYSKALENLQLSNLDIKAFYSFPESAMFDANLSLKIEEEVKSYYQYFNRFREIADSTNTTWDHIDLFYIRETSQNDLKKYIFSKKQNLNDFGKAQLEITKTVLERVSPKLLVVANALASDIFKEEYDLRFDDNHGCYFTEINGRRIPTFLSSMLTGQRALDKYSYERLHWHIAKVLSEMGDR